MKLGIGLLTYERPELLRATIATLWPHLAAQSVELSAVILDNGSSATTLVQVQAAAASIGARLKRRLAGPLALTDDPVERDQRIAAGFAALAAALLDTDCTHALLVEDDWECIAAPPLAALAAVFDARPGLGQIRLRECRYDSGLDGYSARNFVTRRPIVFDTSHAAGCHVVDEGELHWTNNPSLIRRATLDILRTGASSEIETMHAFWRRHPRNGQLRPGVFLHRGPFRRRPDLEVAGVFRPPASAMRP
ncbi:MAG: hypothetical protein ACLGP3_08195 [Acidobacteriota bacterium]|jgi:hypothetical protein